MIDSILRFADKYAGLADSYLGLAPAKGARRGGRGPYVPLCAIHALLLSLVAGWAASALLGAHTAALLALDRARPWTAVTDAWLMAGPGTLPRTLFFGYVFGRAVDNAEGGQGLWLTYVLSAAGAAAAALLLLPHRAPLAGAPLAGALFGLFCMATFFSSAKSWHWHRWFEIAALLPFVALQLSGTQAALTPWLAVGGLKVGAWVPLLGGAAGAAAASGILWLGRLVAAGIQQQQQQQQDRSGAASPGSAQQQEPLSALLSKAAGMLIRRIV